MKTSTLILIIGGVLIGAGLVGMFEPFRSWMGGIAPVSTIIGVAFAVVGVTQAAREKARRRG